MRDSAILLYHRARVLVLRVIGRELDTQLTSFLDSADLKSDGKEVVAVVSPCVSSLLPPSLSLCLSLSLSSLSLSIFLSLSLIR